MIKAHLELWVKALRSRARVLKPTCGVLVHGVRTDKGNIDPSKQTKKENATLHPRTRIIYIEWLTKNGAKKTASSLIVELAVERPGQ